MKHMIEFSLSILDISSDVIDNRHEHKNFRRKNYQELLPVSFRLSDKNKCMSNRISYIMPLMVNLHHL